MAVRRKRKIEALDKSEVSRQKILSNYIRQQLQRQMRRVLPQSRDLDLAADEMEEILSPEKSGNSKSRTPSPKKKLLVEAVAGPSSSGRANSSEDPFHKALEEFREKFESTVNDDGEGLGYLEAAEVVSSSSEEEDSSRGYYGMDYSENFSVINTPDFSELPLETQHEILFEMQESRKMNSWGKIEQMPQDLRDFSSYQMERLVKRRYLQKKIQSVQQEMGQKHIHVQNLDELLKMDYDFTGNKSEVIGSQDKGCVLVKKKLPVKKNTGAEGAGTSSQKGVIKPEPQIITIDDDEWNDDDEGSSDEDNGVESIDSKVIKSNSANGGTESREDSELTEEEQLGIAIQLSLAESWVGGKNPSEKEVPRKSPESLDTLITHQQSENISRSLSSSSGSFTSSLISKQVELSPESFVKNVSMQNQQRQSDLQPSNSVATKLQLSQTSSVSKFLDTVGFSSKVTFHSSATAAQLSPVKIAHFKPDSEDSSSESDFEVVEELEVESESCLQNNESVIKPQSSVAAVIALDEISKTAPPEDDIFADIFMAEAERSKETDLSAAETTFAKDVSVADKNDTSEKDWDSDPDTSSLQEREPISSVRETPESEVSELSKEEFLSKLTRTSAASASDSSKSGNITSNQSITRTLGRRPGQSNGDNSVKFITAQYMQAQVIITY
jgi:hypothetical protein